MANAASSLQPTMPSPTSAPSSTSTRTAALSSPPSASRQLRRRFGLQALFCLLSMLLSSGYRSDAGHVVVRRDRSLGGKEVVVARRTESLKALSGPLSAAAKEGVLGGSVNERVTLRKKRLLKWWPNLEQNEDSFSLSMVDK